ncbi:hypothetical protein F5B19DRAFT_458073 [Rostrohypoxylon terebratum]|nr:hypothetical protein F5B19DRAFT_458073 [Rostrohypoxylon terebratum]
MAKNPRSTTELGSPQSSIPDFLDEKRLPRHLFNIPDDQRKLLEHSTSWAAFQSNYSKPFLNVPPDVFENLKKFHARQLEETKLKQSEEPKATNKSTQSSQSLSHSSTDGTDQDERESTPIPRFQSQEPQSPVDDVSSCTPSPEKNKYPPGKFPKQETPLKSSKFITQLPPVSSPRPTGSTEPTSVKRQPLQFPSSNPEEPLDVEVPIAIEHSIPSVNKSAIPTFATPPSAQVVPCTLPLSEESFRKQAIQKQRIYKPVPPLYHRPNNQPVATHLAYNPAQPGHTDSPTSDTQSSLSIAHTSSSIIPSTIPSEALSKNMPVWNGDSTISQSRESPVSHEESSIQNSPQAQRHSPEYKPQSPILGYSPPTTSFIPQARLEAGPSSMPDSQPPFVRYTVTYPNYNGTIKDFVTACMYIQLQQRRIRASLYDDFIRAWHEGYVPYVQDCDDADPPVKILNAIEWFNEIDDDPLYTSRVITKQNLQSALDHYPEELRSAQSLLGLTPSQAQEVPSTPDAALLAKGHKRASKSEDEDDVIIDEERSTAPPDTPKRTAAQSTSGHTEPLVSMKPPAVKARVLSVHKSFGDLENRPTGNKVLARSFSDVTRQKRKASEDPGDNVPKRLSVNALLHSEAESSTSFQSNATRGERQSSIAPSIASSIAPSSTASSKKRKKKFLDEEKFAQSLNRWKKKREMEGITSSVPVSNTPTSAQRE